MGKWTFDKELQDTATAAAGGYSMGKEKKDGSSGRGSSRKLLDPSTWGSAGEGSTGSGRPGYDFSPDGSKGRGGYDGLGGGETKDRYKRGGYVGARPSGKRMYAKGGMVKGKCGG